MDEARQAQIGDVCARKDMVHEETRKLRMGSVLPLRSPACDGRLGAPTELSIGFIEWAPRLALAAHIQLEQFSQVMAESGSECGVLPARAVAGTVRRARRGGARRWLADRPLLRQTFRAAFQPAPAPACRATASTELVPSWFQLTAWFL